MLQLKISLIVMFLSVKISYGTTLQWRSNQDFDGKLPNTRQNINSLNLIHCSRLCTEDETCFSFFHVKRSHSNCILLDTILTSVEGLPDASAASYYILYGAQSPATTTVASSTAAAAATTPVAGTSPISTTMSKLLTSVSPQSSTTTFPCPDKNEYTTVTLTDNSILIFKVSKLSGNFDQATAICSAEGGFLARITSTARLEYLDAVLTNCQTYYSNYIRIDGFNGEDNSKWVYSNGDIAPMDVNLFSDGYPLDPFDRHCLIMNLDDKVQDYNCRDTADTYVCEKELAV